jgi:Methyltransferase domain
VTARCAVCDGSTQLLFRKQVLARYDVAYFRCTQCGLVQTEPPYWLDEAYDDAISAVDTGLVTRALTLAPKVEALIRRLAPVDERFLDSGGGSGLFVRLMRDRGLRFYRHDPYAAPIFSRGFDLEDLPPSERRFALITAFEVLEHLPAPVQTLTQLLQWADTVVCTTDLVPTDDAVALADWWYLGAAHGQHVCFYGTQSLRALAQRLGASYHQLEPSLHVLTRRPAFEAELARPPDERSLESLTWADSLFAGQRRVATPLAGRLVRRVERRLARSRLGRWLSR